MQIRRIKIERYRGIESLEWEPGPGLNCIIGAGDVGKTTILDAISLALTPAPIRVASEHDYLHGEVGRGFKIDLVLGKLTAEILGAWPVAPTWMWAEDENTKKMRVFPDPDVKGEAALCLRVEGTEDLEINHYVIDPSDGTSALSPSKRQKFGLSTLGRPGAAYRELRMSRGSLLERNLDSEELRSLVTEAVQTSRENFEPSQDIDDRLGEIAGALREVAPQVGELDLAMLPPRGQNLLSMVGLFSGPEKQRVPLSNAGLGTQQLALFTLAHLLLGDATALFVIDEAESGLEPFRQRDLVARVRKAIGQEGQAFLTTHSSPVVGALEIEEMFRFDPSAARPTTLASVPQDLHRMCADDPEAVLSRLPVVMEGRTELYALAPFLDRCAEARGTSLGAVGIRLVDGGGQPSAYKVTDGLKKMGMPFAAFLDTEVGHQGKRDELADADGVAFGTLSGERCIEEAVAEQLTLAQLDALIARPVEKWDPTRNRLQSLNDVAGRSGRGTVVDLAERIGEPQAREMFAKTALEQTWFKHAEHATVLGEYLIEIGGTQIERDIEAFGAQIMSLLGIPAKEPEAGDDEQQP